MRPHVNLVRLREKGQDQIRVPHVHVAEHKRCGDNRGKSDADAIGLPVRAGANLARRAVMVDVIVDDEPIQKGRFPGLQPGIFGPMHESGDEVGDEQADQNAAGVGEERDDDVHVPTVAAGTGHGRP